MGLYVLGLMEGGPASRSQKIQVCVQYTHKLLFDYKSSKYKISSDAWIQGMFESETHVVKIMLRHAGFRLSLR